MPDSNVEGYVDDPPKTVEPDAGTNGEIGEIDIDAFFERDDVKAKLEDMLQREGDRRANEAVRTRQKEEEARIKAAKEQAKKEAREKRLLEEGKEKELIAELREQAQTSQNALAEYLRKDQINQLLDNKEITDPAMRKIFLKMPGELEELSGVIDDFKKSETERVQAQVKEQMKSDPPPKGKVRDEETAVGAGNPSAEIAALEKKMWSTTDPVERQTLQDKIRMKKYELQELIRKNPSMLRG